MEKKHPGSLFYKYHRQYVNYITGLPLEIARKTSALIYKAPEGYDWNTLTQQELYTFWEEALQSDLNNPPEKAQHEYQTTFYTKDQDGRYPDIGLYYNVPEPYAEWKDVPDKEIYEQCQSVGWSNKRISPQLLERMKDIFPASYERYVKKPYQHDTLQKPRKNPLPEDH